MRFIINFFLFGFLFFLIYVFFPDAFKTLVSWAQAVYDFFNGLVQTGIEKSGMRKSEHPAEAPKQAMAMLHFILNRFW
jgi:hypothetical protein